MEGAGKFVEDDELREAMQEKGLGTPATRAATIEGLINEKYMLREGRELIPTAKAFQLMTLLRGLGVEELSKPELTGEWEYKLAQMEHGKLSRETFMHEIADMTKRIVMKAKEYDRDTVPGDYATLKAPCPNCGGVVQETYRRYNCVGKPGRSPAASRSPRSRRPRLRAGRGRGIPARTSASARCRASAPRPAGPSPPNWRWPTTRKRRTGSWSSTSARTRTPRPGEIVDLSAQEPLGPAQVRPPGVRVGQQLRLRALRADARAPDADLRLPQRQDHPAAAGGARADGQAAGHRQDRPAGQVRLDAHAAARSRPTWPGTRKRQGELRIRAAQVQVPAAPGCRGKTAKEPATPYKAAAKKPPSEEKATAKAAKKVAARKAPAKKTGPGLKPSPELAAVVGDAPIARTEVIKKIWDYIKAHGLQDQKDKRAINADAKLKPLFGKPQVSMFELAGIVGKHLSSE
jgi:DNA topoisomerase-3